jgi:hypothetical protein
MMQYSIASKLSQKHRSESYKTGSLHAHKAVVCFRAVRMNFKVLPFGHPPHKQAGYGPGESGLACGRGQRLACFGITGHGLCISARDEVASDTLHARNWRVPSSVSASTAHP